jgi:hypothetical protein
MISEQALFLARTIWEYHQLRHEPIPADVIIAMGTNDLRVAEFAADLYRRGYGSTLVCSGGIAHEDDLLATPWEKTEAEMYAEVAGTVEFRAIRFYSKHGRRIRPRMSGSHAI